MVRPGFQCVTDREIELSGIKDVVLFGDVGCLSFGDESKKVFGEILKIKTDLYFILGDLAFTGEQKEFEEIIDFCNQRAEAPVFTICGNHDVRGFSDFFGLRSYALILDRFVILAIDNAHNHFEKKALDFLEEMLNKHKDKRFLVTFHVPPPTDLHRTSLSADEWEKVKAVSDRYRDKIESIFCGHIHGFQEHYLDGYRIFISGGGGAALYNLEKDTLKSHHAIKVTFKEDGSLDINVIPIKTGAYNMKSPGKEL